jgi:hypothetical protein
MCDQTTEFVSILIDEVFGVTVSLVLLMIGNKKYHLLGLLFF